jgi:hypothetical protein
MGRAEEKEAVKMMAEESKKLEGKRLVQLQQRYHSTHGDLLRAAGATFLLPRMEYL